MLPPWQILIKEPVVSGVVIEGIVEREKSEKSLRNMKIRVREESRKISRRLLQNLS
jgi:ribosomal protein L21